MEINLDFLKGLQTIPLPSVTMPDTLGGWILVSLDDLRRCEEDSAVYRIDMSAWHEPGVMQPCCHVCEAGAMLAQRFCLKPTISDSDSIMLGCGSGEPKTPKEVLQNRLGAINSFREGFFSSAVRDFYFITMAEAATKLEAARLPWFVRMPDYDEDREAFYVEMTDWARQFEADGI